MSRLNFGGTLIFSGLLVLTLVACAGAPASTSAPQPASRPVAGEPGDGEENPPPDANQQPTEPVLIVHTGTMALEVSDVAASVDQANALIQGLGGHVASSHESTVHSEQAATVTYRIPAERWSEALAGLQTLGRLLTETTEAEDVTAQVVDLDARIANLRASEAALQSIMTRAGTIDDVLRVQRELTSVRSEIESMIAQRDHLANLAALGTLEVTFETPVVATTVASQGWDLGREVDNALAAPVRETQGLATVAIWLSIAVLPVVLPFVVVGYVAYRLRRRYLAGRPAHPPMTPSV